MVVLAKHSVKASSEGSLYKMSAPPAFQGVDFQDHCMGRMGLVSCRCLNL